MPVGSGKLPRTKGEAAVAIIEKLGHVNIGRSRARGRSNGPLRDNWYATAFSRNSNAEHRGYGPTLLDALRELDAKKVEADK